MPDQKVVAAVPTIIERLRKAHPDARYELDWENPLQLLVATILAAQCTDERVNQVTPGLFKKYPTAKAYAEADITELETILKPTGFYRQKAKTVQEVCKALVDRFKGEVPRTMEEMVTLPGVARKTANVVLTNAFQLPTGVIVDTHVQRVSQRMGLTDQKSPEKIELDLMKHVPKDDWIFFGPAMVLLGRYTCTFHEPDCAGCPMNDLCPKRNVDEDTDETSQDEEETPTMARKTSAAKKTKAPAAKKKAPAAPKKKEIAASVAPVVPSLCAQLPSDWQDVLQDEFDKPYFKALEKFVAQERAANVVYPPEQDVFNAFKATPFAQVKVVLLGQDPYHGEGEAHGMCFSVKPGVKIPPSLANIHAELHQDLGHKPPKHGYLASWAAQGVLLMNAVLTVRANEPNSHKEQGWEQLTDAVIRVLNARSSPVVFLLWGAYAQKKALLIDSTRHRILPAAHPSPLSSKKFFGSKPFSSANKALQELGQGPVNWELPADPLGTTAVAPPPKAAAAPVRANPAPVPAPAPAPAEESTRLETFLPGPWREFLAEELKKPTFRNLDKFLAGDRRDNTVFPEEGDVFNAFKYTPFDKVRVVILEHEPRHTDNVDEGLALSVRDGVDIPEALQTVFQELRRDLGCRIPSSGSLVPWAKQGVLLLRSILTVRQGRPLSHKDKGWEAFTDGVLKTLNGCKHPIAFVLLGQAAQKKRTLIDEEKHIIITPEHPAITPAKFLGSGLFTEVNNALELRGRMGIYWQLPSL